MKFKFVNYRLQEAEDELYGIIVRVKEGRKTAFVPVLDLKMNQPSWVIK